MGASYKKRYKMTLDKTYLEDADVHFDKALKIFNKFKLSKDIDQKIHNKYEQIQIRSNIQTIRLLREKFDDVIEIYEGYLEEHLSGKKELERLDLGIYLTTISAWFELDKEKPEDRQEKKYVNLLDDLLSSHFKDKEELLNRIAKEFPHVTVNYFESIIDKYEKIKPPTSQGETEDDKSD